MADNTDTLNALHFYFRAKNINFNTGKAKKLIDLLEAGKHSKFKTRRKKKFLDYDNFIKKAADKYKGDIQQKVKHFDQLLKDGKLSCTRIAKALDSKSTSFQKASTALETNLSNSQENAKNAKDQLKVLDKITKRLEPNASKHGKALAKIAPLKEKGEKALGVIQANLDSSKDHQKRLKTSNRKIQTTNERNNGWLEKLSAAEQQMREYHNDFKALRQADNETALNNTLLQTISADDSLKKLTGILTNAQKTLATVADIDTSYSGGRIVASNNRAWNKIIDLVSLANSIWITTSATRELTFYDKRPFYAYYEDTRIFPSSNPELLGVAANPFLNPDLNKGYTISKIKGKMVKVDDIGWCRYEDLYSEQERNRLVYLREYEQWLAEQHTVLKQLNGKAKLERIRGILLQSQTVIERFNAGRPLPIDTLDKAPAFKKNEKKVTCPHELIQPLRAWIELTERNIGLLKKESAANDNAGSLYSDIDWNTQLKIPQYRTQSDNLISPEATCAPTTFTMMAERAGWSRADMLTAIEKRFKDQGFTDMEKAWSEKGKAFFEWVNARGTKAYQKVRAGKIKKARFEKLAGDFRAFGQYEDLTSFYHYLINSSSVTQINPTKSFNDKLRQGIENEGNFKKEGSYRYRIIRNFKSDLEMRQLVKKQLDRGNVVMFSIFHKGAVSPGTHNYFVQSINHEGFIVDDPYGLGNTRYRRKKGVAFDLYAVEGQGKAKDRKKHDFKNVPAFNTAKKDYTKEAAQDLTDKEARGASSLFTWEMIERSDMRIINYVVLWER